MEGREEVRETIFCRYLYDRFVGDYKHVEKVVPKRTQQENDKLIRPFCKEEFCAALFSMEANSATGLDTVSIPQSVNDTNIVLIPTIDYPVNLKDLRPISLCTEVCYGYLFN